MSPETKNILLIIADDLGLDQLAPYNSSIAHLNLTPNLDALAAKSTVFTHAFASTASCSGSRTTIFTGLHTHQTGSYGLVGEGNGFQTSANVETAPEIFNELGYKTGILNKVHVSPREKYPWQIQTLDNAHPGENGGETRDGGKIADQAAEFFRDAKKEEKAFFLTVAYTDPHRKLGSRGGFGNVDGNYDARLQDRIYTPAEVQVPPYLSDLREVRQELAEYYRAIHRLDQGIGLLLGALESSGLGDDTLILFLSDNGPPFINSKTTLYDAGVHLPFILRVPGKGQEGSNPNLVSYVDILPTFLDWAGHALRPQGAKSGGSRRGKSILPIIEGQTEQEDWSEVFGSHTFHEVTNYWPTRYMRTRRYKYHRNVCWKLDFPFAMDLYASLSFEGMRNSGSGEVPAMIGKRKLKDYIARPPEELYDLENDPLEIDNLAADPSYKEVLLEMRKKLETWQESSGDLWLWRDGTAVKRYRLWDYAREGLSVPDRFDFDAESPGTKNINVYEL